MSTTKETWNSMRLARHSDADLEAIEQTLDAFRASGRAWGPIRFDDVRLLLDEVLAHRRGKKGGPEPSYQLAMNGDKPLYTMSNERSRVVAGLLTVPTDLRFGSHPLVQRRPPDAKFFAGQYEFPGGKVEDGETDEEALARELHEELGITNVEVGAKLSEAVVDYRTSVGSVCNVALYFISAYTGEVQPLIGQTFSAFSFMEFLTAASAGKMVQSMKGLMQKARAPAPQSWWELRSTVR